MKQIRAIVRDHMVSKVVHALHELPHFPGLTISDAHGQSRGRGRDHAFESSEDELRDARYQVIEIFCTDEAAPSLVQTIRDTAHTGRRGDGVIAVSDLAQVVRIRTGQQQEEAV